MGLLRRNDECAVNGAEFCQAVNPGGWGDNSFQRGVRPTPGCHTRAAGLRASPHLTLNRFVQRDQEPAWSGHRDQSHRAAVTWALGKGIAAGEAWESTHVDLEVDLSLRAGPPCTICAVCTGRVCATPEEHWTCGIVDRFDSHTLLRAN